MPKTDTQNARLLDAMRCQWVTPADAWKIAGTLRFSGRVLELKRAGHKLREQWVETQGRARVKAFRLAP